MKKNYRSILILVTLCCILLYMILNTNILVKEVLDYTELFMKRLFPVSFIFFVLSSLLMDYQLNQVIQRIFHINSLYFYFFFLSLISGFPAGAFLVKEGVDSHIIDLDDANRIIMFSHFPNPLFVLSSVYLVVGNFSYTLYILLAIIISNFIIFIFVLKKGATYKTRINFPEYFSSSLSKAIIKAIKVLITIYGTSLFFYLIAYIISSSVKSPYLYVLINGIFDLTKGVFSTSVLSSGFIRSIFILLFISFGPLSIHLQIKSILADTGVSYKRYVYGRGIGLVLSLIIFLLLRYFYI